MNNLILPHGSTRDWDFSNENWELSPTKFISPPTSLHCPVQWGPNVLLKKEGCLYLPQARIITWYYCGDTDEIQFWILYNAMGPYPGATGTWQFYGYNEGAWRLNCAYNDVLYMRYSFNKPQKKDVWARVLIQWWDSVDGYCNPAKAVQCANWETDHWDFSDIAYDTDMPYKDDPVLRVGFNMYFDTMYVDDFELWVPS